MKLVKFATIQGAEVAINPDKVHSLVTVKKGESHNPTLIDKAFILNTKLI